MNKLRLLTGLLAVGGLVFMAGCDDDEEGTSATVTTAAVSDISTTTATGGGNATVSNGEITERGIVWSENPSPTTSGSKAVAGSGTGDFTASVTGLFNSTEYFVRAYAIAGGQTFYGNEVSFSTSAPIELIEDGDFSNALSGAELIASPWKTEETSAEIIGYDPAEYKGYTGYVWTFDEAQPFYQTVGTVPAVATEYEISFDGTCSWTEWGGFQPLVGVIFSSYSGSDPSTRTVIGSVTLEDPNPFTGWDENVWGALSGSFTLTAEQAAAHAGKNLVIEFDVLQDEASGSKTGVWYDFDNISVIQQ